MPYPKGKPQTKQHRERIAKGVSKAMRKRFLEELEGDKPAPTHKRCSGCEKVKPLSEFWSRKHKLKSGVIAVYPESQCKECSKAQKKLYYQRLKDEGRYKEYRAKAESSRDQEKKRQRGREWAAARRREEGKPVRNLKHNTGEPAWLREETVAAGPLREFLEDELPRRGIGGKTAMEDLSGVSSRRLYAILEGEQDRVSLRTADWLLTRLGFPEKLNALYPLDEGSEPLRPYTYIPA